MENKYLLLRTIAVLFEIVGWLILILGVLATLLFIASTGAIDLGTLAARVPLSDFWRQLRLPAVSAWATVAVTGVTSLLSFLMLCAVGELIFLLLDIEESTRETLRYLRPRV
jgi:hypothetical protein